MATVTAFLKHSTIGKAKQAEPYTASAHARYVTRKNAASLIYSERMPRNYHALQRFLNEREDGLRKNGRVIDKFIISVPHDVSPEDAAKALRRFGYRLGKGKTPFLFALHGFDTRNHHAHFIFIDSSTEDGKRVFGTSERGSSANIKIEWETAANDTFAELGYDVRVKVKEGYELEPDNDNAPINPDIEIESQVVEFTVPEEDSDTEEAPMADDDLVIERIPDNQISLAGNDIRLLHDTVREQNYLKNAQQRVQDAQDRYASLIQQRERATLEAGVYEVTSLPIIQSAAVAEERLRQNQKANGKLKGIGIKLFGYEVKTAARKEAENAFQEAQARKGAAQYAERKRGEYKEKVESLSDQATEAERDAFLKRNELLAAYGTEKDMENAERVFADTVKKIVQSMTPEAARDAYDDGELTPDEYRTFLEQSGDVDGLALLEGELEYERRDYDEGL